MAFFLSGQLVNIKSYVLGCFECWQSSTSQSKRNRPYGYNNINDPSNRLSLSYN